MQKIYAFFVASLFIMPAFIYGNAVNISTEANSAGLTISAWEYHTGTDVQIHAAVQDSLGVWSTTTTLTTTSLCIDSRNPKVAIDSLGNIAVVWIGLDPVLNIERLYGAMYAAGVWTTAQALSSTTEVILLTNFTVKVSNAIVFLNWGSILTSTMQQAVRNLYSPTFGTWGTTIVTIEL